MPKSGYNEIDKECPICGSIIWGKGQRVLLEGAKITVCHNCAQHGVKIRKPPTNTQVRKPVAYQKKKPAKQNILNRDFVSNLELMPDFARKIRNKRNSLGLNQDQFAQKLNEKPSLLRRIETGKVEPTIKLAKKIEEIYNLKLLKKIDEIEVPAENTRYMKKSTGTSLGDIAFIKKKKQE
ncbi:MAG: multiprotein bridging factor aMBF1 [Candidatus Thorarchaeota archaeon]